MNVDQRLVLDAFGFVLIAEHGMVYKVILLLLEGYNARILVKTALQKGLARFLCLNSIPKPIVVPDLISGLSHQSNLGYKVPLQNLNSK